MADPFVAEIRIFPFNFAPKGWAFCSGQLMPISQNTALFSLLGTTYGGDGKSTFALPDMQGNAPMHPGQGQGLSLRDLGQIGGSETITLLQSEMPAHTHSLMANTLDIADTNVPSPNASFALSSGGTLYQAAANTSLSVQGLAPAGGGLPHSNMQPYLTLNFCIALQGVFPPRS
jgi:microcystin-dependent protein